MKQIIHTDHLRILFIPMFACFFFLSTACSSSDDSQNATPNEQDHSAHETEDHSAHEADDHSMHDHDGEMTGDEGQIYTCSMHPQVRNEGPGRCPICGMDLIPVSDETSIEDDAILEDDTIIEDDTKNEAESSGQVGVSLSRGSAEQAAIVLAEVKWHDALIEQTIPGKVMISKDAIRVQTAHVSGRIEKLYVREDGEYVQAGQPVASIFSPELISAQKELLEAYNLRNESPDLYDAAKARLKNWEISEAQIQKIEQSNEILYQIDVMADYSGYLQQKRAEVGEHVTPGSVLFTVTDLNSVLISLEASSLQAPWIQIGDPIQINTELRADGNDRIFEGSVEFISPTVHTSRQTTEIRAEVDNLNRTLRPGMLVKAQITSQFSDEPVQVIPSSSVLWTGNKSIVYVAHEMNNGWHYMAKTVSIGPRIGDQVAILSGLEIGELVVKQGAFKIDAVSQLSGNMSMMSSNGTTGQMHHH